MIPCEIAAIRLFVTDIDAARAFYGDTLGWALADLGDALLARAGGVDLVIEKDDEGLAGRFAGVSFRVGNAAAAHAALEAAGVETTGAPTRQPWGGVLGHFVDPSGNTLSYVEAPSGSPAP